MEQQPYSDFANSKTTHNDEGWSSTMIFSHGKMYQLVCPPCSIPWTGNFTELSGCVFEPHAQECIAEKYPQMGMNPPHYPDFSFLSVLIVFTFTFVVLAYVWRKKK